MIFPSYEAIPMLEIIQKDDDRLFCGNSQIDISASNREMIISFLLKVCYYADVPVVENIHTDCNLQIDELPIAKLTTQGTYLHIHLDSEIGRVIDKKVQIEKAIAISGVLVSKDGEKILPNRTLYVSFWQHRGCIISRYIEECKTDSEGKFFVNIDLDTLARELGFRYFNINMSFFTRIKKELKVFYDYSGGEGCSTYVINVDLSVEHDGETREETLFNFENSRKETAEFFERIAEREREKRKWLTIPKIREYGTKPSTVLTKCETCGRRYGIGSKRYRQCHHCGRWVGNKCAACWQDPLLGIESLTGIYCRSCAEAIKRLLVDP